MKNFDEKIRDKLFDAEMPVSDDLWNYIDSQISNKKERPKYWIFFLVSLILLPGSYLGYKMLYDNSPKSMIAQSLEIKTDSDLKLESDFKVNPFNNNENVVLKNLDQLVKIKSVLVNPIISNNKKIQSLSFQIITEKRPNNVKHQNTIYRNRLNSISKLVAKEPFYLVKSNDQITLEKRKFSGVPQCPSFNGKNNKLYTYANATTSYPIQFLSGQGDESAAHINSRKTTESGFLSFSFDAGLGYQLDDYWFLQAGIMYNEINMKFHLIEEGQTRTSEYIQKDTLRDSNGSIVSIEIDTFRTNEVGIEETLRLNKFKQLDIPISIGYRFPISRRFNLAMSGGIVFNLKNQSQGTILDSNSEPFDYGKDVTTDGPIYLNKIGLSYTGAVKLETEIYPDLFLNAGVDIRYYGGDFNSNENPIDQSYLTLGLGTGIRYKF